MESLDIQFIDPIPVKLACMVPLLSPILCLSDPMAEMRLQSHAHGDTHDNAWKTTVFLLVQRSSQYVVFGIGLSEHKCTRRRR